MSFLGGPVPQARKPLAEVLPDGRKRLTRYFKPTTTGTIPAELNFTPGTADPWTASTDGAPAGWTGLLSTYVQMRDSERGFPQGAEDDKPIVQVIFEQISATGETQTGGTPQTQLPSDRQQVEFTYVMFSSSTYTPQVPGVTAAPSPFTTYFLWEETSEDDGTLRNIKRTYQTAGTVSTDDESLQGGSLLLKKIESFYTVPSTPAGYTSVGTPVQNPNGYPIYTYTFAKGNGEVSRRYVDAQGGTTPFDATTPSSSVGALRCIITYLTDKSVTTNPTTGPTSFVFIGQEIEDRDGYRVWNVSYGYGVGLVVDESTVNDSGTLVTYHRIQFGSSPSAPSATIGGTVTLFESGTRNADGYVIYDYRWAEGIGEVSRRFVDAQGGTTAFNAATPSSSVGSLRCIITYFTATSVTSNPATGPASFVFIGQEYEIRNGYKIWTITYGYGAGLITDETDIRVAGGWVLYHRIQFGGAPTTPSSTIGGTVTLFQSETRNSDGYVIYDYRWTEGHTITASALGSGLVVNDVQTSASGALVIYHRIQFGGAPTAPAATIGGTVTLFENNQRQESGFIIYDYRWSEGSGQASITTTGEPDGALVYTVVDYDAAAATPADPTSGSAYLISLRQQPQNGYFINTAVYKKPPASVGFRKMVKFFMPGLASISGSPILYSQEPPVTMDILATVTVDYGTTQITTTPFTVSAYAKLNAQWIPYTNPGTSPTPGSPPADTTTGPPQGYTESLGGYLAGASGTSASNQYFNGVFVATYTYTLSASTPSTRPSGATTIAVDNDPYLVTTSGTVIYRRTVTTYSF